MNINEFTAELQSYCNDIDIPLPSFYARCQMRTAFNASDDDFVDDWIECNDINFKDYEPVKSYPKAIFATCTTQPVAVYADCSKDTNMKTDTATQRDYLLQRVQNTKYAKRDELSKTFHLYKNSQPRTYAELIEYIKEGKYELDTKRTKRIDAMVEDNGIEFMGMNPFDGIKFTARPSADLDGYNDAEIELDKQIKKAKDVIMSDVYADGLAALQALEAWVPEGKAN